MAKKKKNLTLKEKKNPIDAQKEYQLRMIERAKEIEERIKGRNALLNEE
jgi:hypothetical protein|tara:strand:+ start:237 stop:383 length:147 start_codon:yes stop_codon:yes gene_type:complete